MESLNRIVLIHGGAHGAWCWEKVVPLLRDRGFVVVAPDLPGSGDDHRPAAGLTKADYIARVVEALERSTEPALLLGHSMGGGPISGAAEYRPDLVGRLVYLSAFLPQDGEASMSGNAILQAGKSAARGMILSEDGTVLDFDRSLAAEIFYNNCAPDIAASATARLGPQPTGPLAGALRLTPERWGAIPKTYLFCRQDNALPPEAQRWMCDRVPDIRIVEHDWDHSPFFSDPERLVEVLAGEAKF